MAGFVYIWLDRLKGRFYIGSHWGSPDDGYVCSSPWMKRAYNRRPGDFKRRIIATAAERTELLKEEERWLQMIGDHEVGKKYYNLRRVTGHWSVYPENVKTIREKISLRTKERMADPEVRTKYEEGLKRRSKDWITDEVRIRKSESMKRRMAEKFPQDERKDKRSRDGSRSNVKHLII